MTGLVLDHTLAPRGKIYDRTMRPIADVKPRVVITAKPVVLKSNPEAMERLAKILGTTTKKIEWTLNQQWSKGNFPTTIFVGATVQQATKIAESGEDAFPGVGVQTLPMRSYGDTSFLEHILGFVWVPTASIEEEYKKVGMEFIPPYVGRDGIERIYDRQLMGKPGSTTYTLDRKRRPLRVVMSESPTPGESLVLSIDMETQRVAREALGDRKGAVVALDPNTGEVLAMVSTPGYDLRIYEGGLTQTEFDSINLNKSAPLLKRGMAGEYPPGSTFKIVTAMAAYQAGKFNPSSAVSCPGYLTVGNRRVKCENHPAATYGFHMAMTKSCNSFFGKMSQRLTAEEFKATADQLGFGVRSGIDLPGERKGVFPDRDFIKKAHKRPYSAGDANNIGIGQGDVLVTPLQMALLVSMVANEGVCYKPRVLRGVMEQKEGAKVQLTKPEELHRFDATEEFWRTMKSSLINVVNAGTARSSQISGIQVAGKTGSAENSQSRRTHAWFVGYAPAEKPKIAFAILVETAGHGGSVAAPIAKQVVSTYLRDRTQKVNSNAVKIGLSLEPDSSDDIPESE